MATSLPVLPRLRPPTPGGRPWSTAAVDHRPVDHPSRGHRAQEDRGPAGRPQDLARDGAVPRDGLLRARGAGGVRRARLRRAGEPRGAATSRPARRRSGGSARGSCTRPSSTSPVWPPSSASPARGTSPRRSRSSPPGCAAPTARCAGCAATCSTTRRSPRPSSWRAPPSPAAPPTAGRSTPPTPTCPGPSRRTWRCGTPSTLLREFRGDGHVAVLVGEGVSGLEAAVLHVASHESWSRRGLQATRAYSDEEWDGAVAGLVERGWLTPDAEFTDTGRAHRARVEHATDRLALPAWAALGEDRLRAAPGARAPAVQGRARRGRPRHPVALRPPLRRAPYTCRSPSCATFRLEPPRPAAGSPLRSASTCPGPPVPPAAPVPPR